MVMTNTILRIDLWSKHFELKDQIVLQSYLVTLYQIVPKSLFLNNSMVIIVYDLHRQKLDEQVRFIHMWIKALALSPCMTLTNCSISWWA